jgi:purine-binding chemotaxis protein CheW
MLDEEEMGKQEKIKSKNGYQPGNGFQASELERQRDGALTQAELAEVWARRAYALAAEPPAEITGQTLDLLVFWMGGEQYGIEVAHVREIYPLNQLTPVPRTPPFVAGIFSARGRILSVIDLRAFLGMSPLERSGQTKIVIVASTDPVLEMEIGILTDEVSDVITIFKESIEPPLTTQVGTRADYLQGITADLLIVLNLSVLLNDKRLIIYEEIL